MRFSAPFRSPALAAALLLIAGAVQAQVVDPIGALLDQVQTPPPATETPVETAPGIVAPTPAPPPYVPPPTRRPRLDAPVQIEETGRTPDGPPTANDRNYEARMRASFAASQGMQGPLDGRWVVRAAGGELFELQLSDRSQGTLEGAWRDPRRKGAADASGFIDDIQRYGNQLTVRIQARQGVDPVRMVLEAGLGGGWSGQLTEAGERRAVTMGRN
jgi:hypothetical protein